PRSDKLYPAAATRRRRAFRGVEMYRFIPALLPLAAAVAQPCTWSALDRGVDGSPQAMATFDDGSGPALYVGGGFQAAGSLLAFGVARWDGDSWSAVGPGL